MLRMRMRGGLRKIVWLYLYSRFVLAIIQNIRVTEPLQLSARGFYRTEAPNTRFPLTFLSPALRKQPVIGPYFER